MGFIQRAPEEFIDPTVYDVWMTRGFPQLGDVLFTTEAPLGNVAQLDTEETVVIGQRLITLQTNRDKVDPTFLKYALISPVVQAEIHNRATGATVLGIKASLLKQVPIPLPALEEQKRIVAVLDEAFEGLARARVHAEANLQNARALIEAGLGTAFNPVTAKLNGWDLSDLSSMAKLSYGYTTKANSEPNGPKFLRITDIQDGTVDWDNVPFCSTPPDDYERYRVKSGDILFARTGATTGKSYLMTDEIEAVAASYLIRLRLASMALKPEYLALFFQSDVYWETIRAGISGSTQGGFNASKLGELVVPVPPLAIQDVVISRLEEIQDQAARLTSTYFVKLQDLDDLRQSLLQKAFAGELT
jgi:type I restriction enzyme S subunit